MDSLQLIMLYRYLERCQTDAENNVTQTMNACHWRRATVEDHFRLAVAQHRLQIVSQMVADIYNVLRLYRS